MSLSQSTDTWNNGVLSSRQIKHMIQQGWITVEHSPCPEDSIQPASLDLRLGQRIWMMQAGFSPGPEPVCQTISSLALGQMALSDHPCLMPHVIYVAEIEEGLCLPKDVCASFSPKSSTGRLDIFTRIIADGTQEFDKVPTGHSGSLYLEISPRSFPITLGTGSRLCQARFHKGNTRSETRHRTTLSVDLHGQADGIVGYQSKSNTKEINILTDKNKDPSGFWTPILTPKEGRIILHPGAFYLLSSKETIAVESHQCAEMVAFDATLGEFRAHYAGFFDPGFGTSEGGGAGSKAVLEVRAHDMPFLLRDGQPICRMAWETMSEAPPRVYGQDRATGHSYQGQRLRLPRLFKQD
jgi:dCTP deaminase